MLSVILLVIIILIAVKVSPREKAGQAEKHGAGQIGMLAALALFGVDYFTSYYYATGEMMSALHPYGLQRYGYMAVAVIGLANFVFGALYMYSLGIFNEGGGSYTASMRYLWPTLSLIVAVTLIQDYVLTIVVSALSGADQLLSVLNAYGAHWFWHFAIGASLAAVTWFLTIRGRGESSRVVFTLLTVFGFLTVTMLIGLIVAHLRGVPAAPVEQTQSASFGQAILHMLTASMKGMVALTGLEAMSNGIQFVIDEDAGIVQWGKKHAPRLRRLWNFYSGKAGIGRFVQTSFLFYGGLTTFFLTYFSIRFNVFDGTLGRTLVGNLAFIGFSELPGGTILFWAYQILAVALLAAASMTAFQDAQATEWRDVAIGEIPEVIIYRDRRGTFTRSVTITFAISILIMLLVRGLDDGGRALLRRGRVHADHGHGPCGAPAPAAALHGPRPLARCSRRHLCRRPGRARLHRPNGRQVARGRLDGADLVQPACARRAPGAALAGGLPRSAAGKSHRARKARVQGGMASIVKWQAFKMQEYRFRLMLAISSLLEMFGVGQLSPRRFAAALSGGGSMPISQFPLMKLHTAAPVTARFGGGTPAAATGNSVSDAFAPRHFHLPPPTVRHRVLVPITGIHQGSLTALRYARSLSSDVTALHVSMDPSESESLHNNWPAWGDGIRLVELELAAQNGPGAAA